MKIDYIVSEKSTADEVVVGYDMRTADYNDFTYSDIFFGEVTITDESTKEVFNIWVLILDLAEEMYLISKRVGTELHCVYDFTTSGQKILFDKEDDRILISRDYQDGVIQSSLVVFNQQVYKFLNDALNDLLRLRPETKKSPYIAKLKAMLKD